MADGKIVVTVDADAKKAQKEIDVYGIINYF